MFSFRSDKVGFFSGLVLLILVSGALLSTLILYLVGGWEQSSIWIKIILGATWVLCVVTVYVRVQIFRRQLAEEERKAAGNPSDEQQDGGVNNAGANG